MIKCNLPVLMAKKRLKVKDVAEGTGIARLTIHSLYYEKSKGVHMETIDKLCNFFNCSVGDLLERVKETG